MSQSYQEFLAGKVLVDPPTGLADADSVVLGNSPMPFQADIIRWALRRGRAAVFADCGMGKTLMELLWCQAIGQRTGQRSMILTPLAVAEQTVAEAEKFGIGGVVHCRSAADVADGTRIIVTNYERLDHFEGLIPSLGAVALDESSILKAYDGKTRTRLIESFHGTPFRLAATATPAPNDYMELGNHAEFLGVMTRAEMLARFFVHDGGDVQKWRLKGHAESDFWQWLASWAVLIRKPSDLGYDDGAFVLPPCDTVSHVVAAKYTGDALIAMPAATLPERIAARRESVAERVAKAAEIVNASPGPWVVWCDRNDESAALTRAIEGAVEVRGSDAPDVKSSRLLGFSRGEFRVMVSKPSIAGWGMNWQHCNQVCFVGLTDSWEAYYQAVRRCWRFGQEQPVTVHIVTSDTEGAVIQNIRRKSDQAEEMALSMVEAMRTMMNEEVHGATARLVDDYVPETATGKGWRMERGDCVEGLVNEPDASVDFSVYSPPFASLYTYSSSPRDLGNCDDHDTFHQHYLYVIRELLRATKPGRLTAVHCMNLPTSKVRDGVIGIRDFRGEIIRAHEAEGWIYHSEVTIWKDPVTAMQRTKALGLLYKQLRKDSAMSRQGIPDYLVVFRKPGDNPEPVTKTSADFPVSLWQRYASPVWMDINPSDTLTYRSAREHDDERHICPLQLDVIRRAVRLWTNPGDVVLSPFAGIGSEGVVSLEMGRQFVGFELKESYHRQAVANLRATNTSTGDLFGGTDAPQEAA